MDLVKEYVNDKGGKHSIKHIAVTNHATAITADYSVDDFNKHFEEYVDPKDLEIARLIKQLEDLKRKHKPVRKKKRHLNPAERAEIYTLILNGEDNPTIAEQYDISTSSVSRLRKTMPEAFVDKFVEETD